jgi:hypothetical protein
MDTLLIATSYRLTRNSILIGYWAVLIAEADRKMTFDLQSLQLEILVAS